MTQRTENEVSHGKWLAERDAERTWGWGSPAGKVRASRRAALVAAGAGLGPETTALEIGCGTGLFTEMFAESGAQIVAVDISAELVARAVARGLPPDRVRFIVGRFEACDVDGPFDAVIGSSVLHHLDLGESLRRIRSLLKAGGVLCFAEPNMLNPQVFAERKFRRFFPQVSPDETAFVRWRLARELTKAGFTSIRITPFDWLHPYVPAALIRAVSALGRAMEAVPVIRECSGSLCIFARRT